MPRADQRTLQFLTSYFAAMETKDVDRLSDYYADDMTLTFANAATVRGRDAIVDQMASLLDKVNTLAHTLVNVWQEDDGHVLLEVDSVWRFPDGVTATIRACSIFTIADARFTDQRIYVDNSSIDSHLRGPGPL